MPTPQRSRSKYNHVMEVCCPAPTRATQIEAGLMIQQRSCEYYRWLRRILKRLPHCIDRLHSSESQQTSVSPVPTATGGSVIQYPSLVALCHVPNEQHHRPLNNISQPTTKLFINISPLNKRPHLHMPHIN